MNALCQNCGTMPFVSIAPKPVYEYSDDGSSKLVARRVVTVKCNCCMYEAPVEVGGRSGEVKNGLEALTWMQRERSGKAVAV